MCRRFDAGRTRKGPSAYSAANSIIFGSGERQLLTHYWKKSVRTTANKNEIQSKMTMTATH